MTKKKKPLNTVIKEAAFRRCLMDAFIFLVGQHVRFPYKVFHCFCVIL